LFACSAHLVGALEARCFNASQKRQSTFQLDEGLSLLRRTALTPQMTGEEAETRATRDRQTSVVQSVTHSLAQVLWISPESLRKCYRGCIRDGVSVTDPACWHFRTPAQRREMQVAHSMPRLVPCRRAHELLFRRYGRCAQPTHIKIVKLVCLARRGRFETLVEGRTEVIAWDLDLEPALTTAAPLGADFASGPARRCERRSAACRSRQIALRS
jgi:hypothetical protein